MASHLLRVQVGPISLPPHAHHVTVEHTFVVPIDGWFLSYDPRVIRGDGTLVLDRVVHHLNFFRIGRRDLNYPRRPELFYATGAELRAWPELPDFGYRVKPGVGVTVWGHLENPTSRRFDQVYLEVDIHYQPFSQSPKRQNVYPIWFFVGPPVNFDIPPGSYRKSGLTTIRLSGKLLGIGGHIHDFGTRLVLENPDQDEPIATLLPVLKEDGQLINVPILIFGDGGHSLRAGTQVRVTADYYNPTGALLVKGGMGMIGGYFLPNRR